MKSLKNSLRRLNFRISFGDIHPSSGVTPTEEDALCTDLEAKRHAYHQGVGKMITFKNVELLEDAISTRVLEDLEDFELREDDVFLLSYPASNVHLLEDIVQSLLIKYKTNKQKSSGGRQRDPKIPIGRLEVSNPYGHVRWLKGLKSPRLFSTNLPFELLPNQVQNAECKVRLP